MVSASNTAACASSTGTTSLVATSDDSSTVTLSLTLPSSLSASYRLCMKPATVQATPLGSPIAVGIFNVATFSSLSPTVVLAATSQTIRLSGTNLPDHTTRPSTFMLVATTSSLAAGADCSTLAAMSTPLFASMLPGGSSTSRLIALDSLSTATISTLSLPATFALCVNLDKSSTYLSTSLSVRVGKNAVLCLLFLC